MKKQVGILFGIAISFSIVACGNSSNEDESNNSVTDTNSTNVRMLDSGANATPAQGMGDSSAGKDSNTHITPGSANDSVKRIGGSSTSDGDSNRRRGN